MSRPTWKSPTSMPPWRWPSTRPETCGSAPPTAAAADLSIEAQTPAPVIGTLSSALGLAFDATKNLWVSYDGVLAKITPAEQAATVTSTITPAVQVSVDVLALPAG